MTIKQQLFIRKYLSYGNATKAVMEIYNTESRNSAGVIGCRLLRNVKVRREIDSILESEGSISSYMTTLLKNTIEFGNAREKFKALQMTFKLHGVL